MQRSEASRAETKCGHIRKCRRYEDVPHIKNFGSDSSGKDVGEKAGRKKAKKRKRGMRLAGKNYR